MARLIYIRHGETDWNAEGRLQGGRDIPLNARGRNQADAVGRSLRAVLAGTPATFVASPLGRACETMRRVRAGAGLPPDAFARDDRLREIGFGAWEGFTWPQLKRADPLLYHARKAAIWTFQPPGGESYAMLRERVAPWFDGLRGDIVAVAHGGVARALLVHAGGVAHTQAPTLDIHQGRILVIEGGTHVWL